MAILVPVNGALEGAWSWNRFVVPRLRASGYTVFATTLIGLGDRTDLAHPGIDLDTHVQDIVNVLYCEDLQDVIRVGHSYGGSDYRRGPTVWRTWSISMHCCRRLRTLSPFLSRRRCRCASMPMVTAGAFPRICGPH